MPKNNLFGKALSLGISILMISLLFFDLIPISSAVFVSPGTIDDTSVNIGTTITFDDVNLTIRGPERIPVSFLNFTIFDGNTEIAHVKFNIDGTVIEQYPSGKFTVTSLTDISGVTYGYGGSYYGYDEMDGTNHSFVYGYGYGEYTGYSDTYILYRITYTTHATGTFYARLFVNSVSHTFVSDESTTFTVSSGTPPEIYVDNNNTEGPWDGTSEHPYRSIQAGIDAANIGGTIYVNNGTYNENIVISKSVNVIGAGTETTIVENSSLDHVFYVTADSANISGFTVKGANFQKIAGIYLIGANHCTISDNNISNNGYGIQLRSSTNNILANNNASLSINHGIYIADSSNNLLVHNYAFSSTEYGIYLSNSFNNTLTGNTISSNNKAGIHLVDSFNNTLADNNISENIRGIYLETSSSNTLTNNKAFLNMEHGIYLEVSSNNILTNNNASENMN